MDITMPLTKTLLPAMAVLTFAACGDPTPVAGGPCAYETSVIEATVQAVDTDGVLFGSTAGEMFVAMGDMSRIPEVGETFTLQVERIIQGTCTPEIVTVIEASDP